MFALPICANQLNEDVVKSGGKVAIGSGYGDFILHHFHSGKQENPGGEGVIITSND